MNTYINRFYMLAEYWQYGALSEELIRDRLVMGVIDDKLSEKLLSEADLTLEISLQICRQLSRQSLHFVAEQLRMQR